MTEDEIRFLEVIYNRGSLAEKSYLNYMHASLGSGSTSENVTHEVETIFSRFSDSGLITGLNSPGLYSITPLGKEKFESLSTRAINPLHAQLNYYTVRRNRFHLSRRVWIALAIILTISSIALSSILAHWEELVAGVKQVFF